MLGSYKTIRDVIYGFVEVPEKFFSILHHPLFQRLRWISQMSLAQMIYPGAVHTRFEHSLGTMHLAHMAAKSLIGSVKENKDKSEICKEFYECIKNSEEDFVTAAMAVGLLHDIGHAPFSHVFEMAVEDYDHEEIGYIITKHILENSEQKWVQWTLETLNKEKPLTDISPPAQVLRTLVDGKGIDIDKGDYLVRDSHHCGVSYGIYGWERLWNNITIVKDEKDDKEIFRIGVTPKAVCEAYHLLIARFHMYEAVYEHHTKQKIDAVIAYLLRKSQGIFSPTKEQIIEEPEKSLLYWNDGFVISKILESNLGGILERVYRRELPTLSDNLKEIYVVLPKEKSKRKQVKNDIKDNVWKLAMPHELFPYFYTPQEPFPVEGLYEIKVREPETDNTSTLFEWLEIRNVQALDTRNEAWEETPRSSLIRVKAYSYNEDKIQEIKSEWDNINKSMDTYRSLLA